MTDALTRLRTIFGPDWPAFLRQLGGDLRAQRAVLAGLADAGGMRAAVHVVAALAATAGEEALAAAARAVLDGQAKQTADLLDGIDGLIARIDGLLSGGAA